MDGISATAAVLGLVQAGTNVITALGRYVSSAREADSSRVRLLDQIKLMSAAATTIESVVRNSSPSLRPPALQTLVDEWFREDGPPRKCKVELDELASWLESQHASRKHKRLAKMISWPFKEDKIKATISAFEGYMPYFRDILSIETFNRVESTETRHRNDALASMKMKLLSWLDGFDCTDKHEFTLGQRQQTTGDWLFKERLYVDWRDGSTDFIWLHGKAGAGKSVLASAVIDNISNGLAENETLAYFYCDFRNSRCTSAMEVLRSVAKQLLWNSKNDWLPSFADLTAREQRGARPPTDLKALSDLLIRASRLHARPVVVVDALDECEDTAKLLEQLVKLSPGRFRLFVTSRTLHAVKEAFTGLPSISLDERVDEVRNDMYFHIKAELQSRSRLKVLKQDLKNEIKDALVRKAGGMFRWVQCQLDRLNDCWSVGDVREVLDTLPRTLYGTYDRMLEAIDRTEFGHRIARRALVFLVLALAPLKLSQLADALTINIIEPSRDVSNAPLHGTDILEVCGSLITFDEKEGIITLSHFSVKEYLTSGVTANNTYFVDQPLGCYELSLASIHSVILYTDASQATADYDDQFYSYALRSGFQHLANCRSDHNEVLVRLLLSLQNHVSTHRLEYGRQRRNDTWVAKVPGLALYIVIRFGHLSMLQYYLDHHPVLVTEEDNPLVYAAFYCDPPRVQLLLDMGLDINLDGLMNFSLNTYKMSPLAAATRNQTRGYQEPLVKLLLARGCIVPTHILHSALWPGIGAPCKSVVIRILLDHSPNSTVLVAGGKNLLHILLEPLSPLSGDDFEIACMLVTAGCDPLALDDHGFSPFHYAINGREIAWVQWLLQNGFRLPPDAMLHAFQRRYQFVEHAEMLHTMQCLVANNASAKTRDADGCNAFHHLVRLLPIINPESMVAAIRLLLCHGCDINCKNESGETPLHLITGNHFVLGCVELFMAHGAKLPTDIINYSVTNQGLSFYDVGNYVTDVLTPLVKIYGAGCRSVTLANDNALHCLVKRDALFPTTSYPVAKFLLENGCNIRAANSWGATPLQLAIENGHLSTAQLLLSKLSVGPVYSDPTIPYAIDAEGNTIFHRLCRKLRGDWRIELEEAIQRLTILREAGYDPEKDVNKPNLKGFTPLCTILGASHSELSPASDEAILAISVLLDLGASFSNVTPLYLDSFEWASNLPWYRDAIEAYRLSQLQFKPYFNDVKRVYYLLQLAQSIKVSPPVSRLIMDMAEYWAYKKVVRNNIRYTVAYDGVLIALPETPSGDECWIPRRVTFSCKARAIRLYAMPHVTIDVRVRRANVTFCVPVVLKPGYKPLHLPKTMFDVWDEHTPATQPRGKGRLTVAELTPRDSFSVEFSEFCDHYFELEFFQIEVYYAIGPAEKQLVERQ